ncbi:MAG: four helix bundle protein [Candidatus Paceibacterota bacterium]
MREFSFEKLDVWKQSKKFIIDIYRTTKNYPQTEKFGLISQLRRAALSISSNIAEGSSRKSAKDQRRFYIIAYSSAIEVLNQLIISRELSYLSEEDYFRLRIDIEKITAMTNRLHDSTSKRINA